MPELPVMRTEVETPFEQKGMVMRTLMEQLGEEGAELVLLDGIKVITPTGWVLVVPDPEEPTTHVWAEGADRADSERLSLGYVERLRQMLTSHAGESPQHESSAGCRGVVGSAGTPGRQLASHPMNIPDDLRYSVEHEWVRPEGVRVRVGITDYAQDALGDIVYVDLPAVGTEVEVGGKLGEVESTKSVSEIYAPVAGTITAVNDALPDCARTDQRGSLRRRVDLRSGSSGRRRCQRPARPSGLPRPHRRLSAMLALAARPGKRIRAVEYRGCRVL